MRRLFVLAVAALCGCGGEVDADWLLVRRGALAVGVEITGTLQAADSASIGPPAIPSMWEFQIAGLAPEGQVVKEGDLLVEFDATPLREQKLAKENERDATRVELEKRRFEISLTTRDDALKLAEAEAAVRKSVMAADQSDELTAALVIQKAKLDLEAAEASAAHLRQQMQRKQQIDQGELAMLTAKLEAAEREVADLDRDIASMTILAARAGTVIYGSGWGDDKHKVGDTVWRAQSVLEVASLDAMLAEGQVDEADSARLAVGQTVRLRLEAHSDHEVTGKLTSIAKNVQIKSRDVPTKVVQVKLSIDPVDGLALRPGMRYRGEVETEILDNVLIAPLTAVTASSRGAVAYRQSGDDLERIEVVLGKRSKREIQVLEGLAEGDRLARIGKDTER